MTDITRRDALKGTVKVVALAAVPTALIPINRATAGDDARLFVLREKVKATAEKFFDADVRALRAEIVFKSKLQRDPDADAALEKIEWEARKEERDRLDDEITKAEKRFYDTPAKTPAGIAFKIESTWPKDWAEREVALDMSVIATPTKDAHAVLGVLRDLERLGVAS